MTATARKPVTPVPKAKAPRLSVVTKPALIDAFYRRTWEADGGWYAEGKLRANLPMQLGYGSTEERANANLDKQFYVWSY